MKKIKMIMNGMYEHQEFEFEISDEDYFRLKKFETNIESIDVHEIG